MSSLNIWVKILLVRYKSNEASETGVKLAYLKNSKETMVAIESDLCFYSEEESYWRMEPD